MDIDPGVGFVPPDAILLPPPLVHEIPPPPPDPFVIHDAVGRIICAGTTHPDPQMLGRSGFMWTDQQAAMDIHWIDLSLSPPQLRVRPMLELPDTLTMALGTQIILTVPFAGTATFAGQSVEFAAGDVTFAATAAGTYMVRVDAWPARLHRLQVTVTP